MCDAIIADSLRDSHSNSCTSYFMGLVKSIMTPRDVDDWYYDRRDQKSHWGPARQITENEQSNGKQYKPATVQTLVD